ncbi:HAMP domain-containing sensor histidine kinase [Parvularcula sp. LCG005]|uniref:sensor histidine kinase n=1 Tax=Parvularcula sp. LCG005 TaxID=3078805 RepID=UPI0029437437|nr:HAMP domain-containing sensor histidine kinase [Parvularcula sp. LCG005]WOI54186.1 HAMP domain-containing sensor histidine kinase [Parvularcula sp. LCG005]
MLSSYSETFGDALRRQQSAITLRAAKVDAELAYRARGAFLANMNHELRTPLNAITGFAGLLKDAEAMGLTEEKRGEYLDYILQSADLLLSHINTILEIADAESGGAKLRRRAFSAVDVVEQTIDQVREQLAGQASFTLDLPAGIPVVDADPDKVSTAIQHIIDYLVGSAEDHAEIHVTIRPGLGGKSEGFVYTAIECLAEGPTQADIDDALRVFEQFHEGLDRKFEGFRLGLPIAKSFIELNQGKFNIKTLGEKGTLIRFALPVASQEHQQLAEQLAS